MSMPLSLYQSEIDDYINDVIINRIVSGINRKERYSALSALFTPADTPRGTIVNRCRDWSNKLDGSSTTRKLFWLPPFRAWDMLTIGNLSLALLWHIYRTLPQEVLADEKIIYKLGKISVTLPALTDCLQKKGTTYNLDPERYTAITNKAFPADRKSSVSSIFSACEQITELSETFRGLGAQIGSAGKFDSLVVPVIDIDLCLPEQAISLLFAIRNFICCESISCVIAADRDTLSHFLVSLYDDSLTADQGCKTLLALFDDWVYPPPPSLPKMLQKSDCTLTSKDKEYIISLLTASGIVSYLPDPLLMFHCFNRFNSFIGNSPDHYSIEEYTIGLLLFLLGTCQPETLHLLALLPNLKEIIHTFRSKTGAPDVSSRDRFGPGDTSPRLSISSSGKHAGFIEKNSVLLSDLFAAVPASLSDAVVAQWIVKIIPFI